METGKEKERKEAAVKDFKIRVDQMYDLLIIIGDLDNNSYVRLKSELVMSR